LLFILNSSDEGSLLFLAGLEFFSIKKFYLRA
jgi:hypothetical protein